MKNLLFLVLICMLLVGCAEGGASTFAPTFTPTPTPHQNVISVAEQLALENMHYQATRDAAAAQLEASAYKLTATAIVVANAATQTAEARSARATAVRQAQEDAATQQAFEATQVHQGVIDAQTQQAWSVTVTAAVVATQTAYPLTAIALPMYSTAEAGSLRAQSTQSQGNADLVFLTVERQTKKNNMDAYLPWTLIVISFVVGTLAIVMFSMYRQLKRDRNGLLPVETIKHRNGVTYVKPDQMTGSSLTVNKNGQITQSGSDTDFQRETTRRQQLREVSMGKSIPEFKQMVGLLGPTQPGSPGGVNYFDADRFLRNVLGDAEGDVVDGEVIDAN
jgi:hypothetical protein